MKRDRFKATVAVRVISRDLLARIRRAGWMQERKEAAVRDQTRTRQRPESSGSWSQILKVMR